MVEAFRAYCDICNRPSPWFASLKRAEYWRGNHFETIHKDNPMVKQNCRIQKDDVSSLELNSSVGELFSNE